MLSVELYDLMTNAFTLGPNMNFGSDTMEATAPATLLK